MSAQIVSGIGSWAKIAKAIGTPVYGTELPEFEEHLQTREFIFQNYLPLLDCWYKINWIFEEKKKRVLSVFYPHISI